MAPVALVGRGHDLGAALLPDLEHAVDRGRRQVRAVGEHDDRGLDVVAERLQAAAERCASSALPLGAVDRSRGCLDLVSAQDDEDVVDRARAYAFEDRLEQDALLDIAEAATPQLRERRR